MLKLEGYGIVLRALTAETAEQIRIWRNDPEISRFMEFQSLISKTMQEKWLLSIQNEKQFYFSIHSEENCIGMIHLNAINLLEKTADSGLFIGAEEYRGTGTAIGASLLLLEFAFENLELETITAKVNNTNNTAQQYNQLLGFNQSHPINTDFSQWVLQKHDFYKKAVFLRTFLQS